MATSTITHLPASASGSTIYFDGYNLTEQISKLRKKKWVNLQGLIDCSTTHLSSSESGPNCFSISLLGCGSFNTVYRLVFSDDTQLAASVSNTDEEDFNPRVKESEIATMRFVRESGLYPDIPVPKVHAWDTTFNNPAGAPYILMDVVEGENLAELKGEGRLRGLDTLPHPQQLSIVGVLAKLGASLYKPVPFDKIGSIRMDPAPGSYSVGPFMSPMSFMDIWYPPGECTKGPFDSVDERWRSYLEHAMRHALQEWCNRQEDELPGSCRGVRRTPQIFSELYQMLASLIPLFRIPQEYSHLVLHHLDLALRNIIFDKDSLSSDEPKITGVIDWEGAQILPLMLTARYPDDLMTKADYPFSRPGHQEYDWHLAPVDWTSIGDPTEWPKVNDRGKDLDFKPLVSAMVGRFYLRTYFSACYAEQLHLLHGNTSLAHATLFADAVYYLKFHETVTGGWMQWINHARWIRETYWRLRNLSKQGTGQNLLIIGPNVYRNSVNPTVHDLGIFEESLFESKEDEEFPI